MASSTRAQSSPRASTAIPQQLTASHSSQLSLQHHLQHRCLITNHCWGFAITLKAYSKTSAFPKTETFALHHLSVSLHALSHTPSCSTSVQYLLSPLNIHFCKAAASQRCHSLQALNDLSLLLRLNYSIHKKLVPTLSMRFASLASALRLSINPCCPRPYKPCP